MPISAVVFDLGGVLIDWNPRYLFRKLFGGDEEKISWFLENVCTEEWNNRHDLGVSYKENAERLILKFPQYAREIRAYGERWTENLGGAIEESVQIFEELRSSGVAVYALTNFSTEAFPLARLRFPFLNSFDGIVMSGELGIAKPDPAIYRHLLKKFGLSAAQSIFVDDRKENVDAARALGFLVHHYHDPKSLRDHLKELGLLE
ncbi:MAG: HAD family phosphatase [Pseudomonadota bacterium]